MIHNHHEIWMQRALSQARKGAGYTAPNPMVGAVLVKDGKRIGQGYHRRFGQGHAEVNALAHCRKQGNSPAGATLYVTLEPCCHYGKTPPCTQAIIDAGVSEVVVAMTDPNPQVAGQGIAQLRQRGITVIENICREQAMRLNWGFIKYQQTGRPQVILKWAQSLDGKLAFGPGVVRRWLTNEVSRHHVHLIRSRCGAIMVGSQTVIDDDPMLNVRLKQKRPQPLRVIADSRLRIPLESQLCRTAEAIPTLVITSEMRFDSQSEKVAQLQEQGVEVVPCPSGPTALDLPKLLLILGQRGITDLYVEGGATLLGSFIDEDLADQLMVYIAPILLGHHAAGLSHTHAFTDLYDLTTKRFGHDMFINGFCHPCSSALGQE